MPAFAGRTPVQKHKRTQDPCVAFQCRGVLGVIERVIKSPRGSVQRSAFDLDDTIVPARLEDLAVETRWPEEATDDLPVEFESIRDDQGKTLEIHPLRKVAKQSVSVPIASPSRHRRWPEPRPDLDRNEEVLLLLTLIAKSSKHENAKQPHWGAGEKLVLGHPLAATIGDSARCMQNLEKVLFTGPKTSDTVTFICD